MITTRKSIRKVVFGTLVAGSAIFVGSAFTKGEINNLQAETQWFELKANGNPEIQEDYEKVGTMPTCSGSEYVCAINAHPDPNNSELPDLDRITSTVSRSQP